MSHEFDTGFTVRTPAWHASETGCTVLADFPGSLAEARTEAGLDWEPRVVPAFRRARHDLIGMAPDGEPVFHDDYVEVPEARIVERDDTGDVIGPRVGPNWTPIGNGTLFEIVEALLGEGAQIDAAGSLAGGARVWALAKLDEPYTLAGDDSLSFPYLGIVNSHDGSGACRTMPTQVRIVCMNTVQAAWMLSERNRRFFEFRHTANVMDRIEEAKLAIAGTRQDAAAWQEMATELLGIPVTESLYSQFVSEFIPEPEAGIVSDRVQENISTARHTFRSLYDGVTNAAQHGTALALLNTAIEYLDHVRGWRNADTKLGRQLLRPEPLKARAFEIIQRLGRTAN